ncbi:MAG: phosphatidylserine decarboxylase [Bacillota bacterium]|nr:MAG: phosphatidylserine decarboxylase [Bacillota bacterium]
MKLILREGSLYLYILSIFALILFFIHPLFVSLPVAVFFFLLFFFRDPIREHPAEKAGEFSFLSPADGKVTAVDEVEEPYFFKGRAKLVTIFLSPFNVHVNRVPISGKVVRVEHKIGKFKPAYVVDAPSVNERNYVALENEHTKCLLVQIVGVLARRVVCWVKSGDDVVRGEKFGLMKFGSCMQVFMPIEAETRVKVGEHVVGGETVIGVIRNEAVG